MRLSFIGFAVLLSSGPLLAQEDESLWNRSRMKVLEMLPMDDIQAYRHSLHEWESIVRGFRREHNFALTGGGTQGRWRFRKLDPNGPNREESQSFYYRVQYQYHLLIHQGFGYYLGTSLLVQPYESFKNHETMSLERSFSIPGLNLGLVYDVSPGFRILLGLDGHLHRLEHLAYKQGSENGRKVTITARAWGVQMAADIFYRLSWAIRLEAEYRRLSYQAPHNAESYEVNMGMEKEEKLFGLGLVYHLI